MQRSGSSPSRLYCSSFFCECPKFCDLAKQRRKIFWGVSEVGKNDFSLYFCCRCVVFLVLYYSSAAIAHPCTSSNNPIHNPIHTAGSFNHGGLCSCGSVTPGGERSRVGGRTCRSRPGGKGLGGYGLGGLVWVWAGLAWARYFALSLPTAAAAAVAGEASAASAGFFPRLRGVLGAAAPRAPSSLSFAALAAADEAPVAAVAKPRTPSSFSSAAAAAAGEAPTARAGSVETPRAPFLLSCAAAAALGDVSGSCAGAAPLVGGVPGAAAGAAAWLAAVSASCASGRGGAGRRGWPLGRRGRPSRLAQVPGPAAAARPPPPPPASAPRAPRGSPPSTPGRRRGSGSGTGGGGGRPAGGTHRSLPSLLLW